MVNDEDELRIARSESLHSLPVPLLMALPFVFLFWIRPSWTTGILLAIFSFRVVGDLLNIAFISIKLFRASGQEVDGADEIVERVCARESVVGEVPNITFPVLILMKGVEPYRANSASDVIKLVPAGRMFYLVDVAGLLVKVQVKGRWLFGRGKRPAAVPQKSLAIGGNTLEISEPIRKISSSELSALLIEWLARYGHGTWAAGDSEGLEATLKSQSSTQEIVRLPMFNVLPT